MAQYRIVRSGGEWYDFEVRDWWWPFWSMPRVTLHNTVPEAEEAAKRHSKRHSNRVVKNLGKLEKN